MDLQFVRSNHHLVRDNHEKRGNKPEEIDMIIDQYDTWIKKRFLLDQYNKTRNRVTKKVGIMMKNKDNRELAKTKEDVPNINQLVKQLGNKNEYDEAYNEIDNFGIARLMAFSTILKHEIVFTTDEMKQEQERLDIVCSNLGNMIESKIGFRDGIWQPVETPEPNEMYQTPIPPKDLIDLKGHFDLCQLAGIVDFKQGARISGNRGYFFKHNGVLLNRALMNYAMDFLTEKECKLISTPYFMNTEIFADVAQLEDFEETLYKVGKDKHLIATSEQPMTAMFADRTVKSSELPIRYAGLSHCFRKETGSHGSDTLGIFRVHQFEKMEQFIVSKSETSWGEMSRMLNNCMEFYDSLGLSYRIIKIPDNDVNNSASLKYDLEGWFRRSEAYRELVSCTNCTDYISKRIHTRDDKGDNLHMLNSTLMANTRTICCILEEYQEKDGIRIPDVLKPYMKKDFINFDP